MYDSSQVKFQASLGEVRLLCQEIVAFVSKHCNDPVWIQGIELSVAEVANNIVMHGYASEPNGYIVCDMTLSQRLLSISLRDAAPAFNPLEYEIDETINVNPKTFNMGKGIDIVRQVMDDVCYRQVAGENILTMHKNLPVGNH